MTTNADTVDFGGSPAAPYFGPGGRAEATAQARGEVAEDGRKKRKQFDGPTAGPAEAAKEPALQGDRDPEENRTKRDPASEKATKFDTKSKSAVENDQGEPVGDPEVPQPGTTPAKDGDFKHTKSTSVIAKDEKKAKDGGA